LEDADVANRGADQGARRRRDPVRKSSRIRVVDDDRPLGLERADGNPRGIDPRPPRLLRFDLGGDRAAGEFLLFGDAQDAEREAENAFRRLARDPIDLVLAVRCAERVAGLVDLFDLSVRRSERGLRFLLRRDVSVDRVEGDLLESTDVVYRVVDREGS